MRSKLFSFFTFLIILILFTLGSWQVYRLNWKNNLINQVQNSFKAQAKLFDKQSKLFSKVLINGKIIAQPIFIYNLGTNGQYGYDAHVLFKTNDSTIIVNAGWVKKKFIINQQDLAKQFLIEAVLKKPKRKNFFTPENSFKEIFYLDMVSLEKKYNNLSLFIAEDIKGFLNHYGTSQSLEIKIPNNHLQYALTWYSLCFVIILTFLIYKKKI